MERGAAAHGRRPARSRIVEPIDHEGERARLKERGATARVLATIIREGIAGGAFAMADAYRAVAGPDHPQRAVTRPPGGVGDPISRKQKSKGG
jgi:hypothetical protein